MRSVADGRPRNPEGKGDVERESGAAVGFAYSVQLLVRGWQRTCIDVSSMETAGSTSERGIGWQALGFAVVGCAGVATLELWPESGSWVYQSFETAVTRLYWAFVVPLAALFDWGRRMFETRQEIRKAAVEREVRKRVKKLKKELEKGVEEAVREALEDERRRLRERIAAATWTMPAAEVERQLFGSDQP